MFIPYSFYLHPFPFIVDYEVSNHSLNCIETKGEEIMRNIPICSVLGFLLICMGCGQQSQPAVYSGTIEGKEIAVQSELGGIVKSMTLEEGSRVEKNQKTAELASEEYRLRIDEAKAMADAAKAKLDEAGAGSRTEKIREAVAKVEQAQALSEQASSKTRTVETQMSVLAANKAQLMNKLEGARNTLAYQQSRLKKAETLGQAGAISEQEIETLRETVNQAQTIVYDIEKQMSTIDAQMNQTRQEEIAGKAAQASAEAGVRAAQANLDLLRAGDTNYTLRGLLAQKEAADSKLAQAKLLLGKTIVRAPETGTILRKHVEAGEVIKPGATLYTLLKKGELEVVVYVPEASLNQVKTGQKAFVRVDAYPNRSFSGTVTRIASQAEFTPKNVQTPDERTKMVFAVTIKLTDGLNELKPGMPADITFAQTKEGARP
jgi:HlyD family secretion protein